MKLDTLLGAALLSLVVACSGSDDAPIAVEQPAAVKSPGTPEAKGDPSTPTPAASEAATSATGATPIESSPATPALPVALTCESAPKAAPAGKLALGSVNGLFPIAPIDVYATEDAKGLTITLTEHASECGYRSAKLAHATRNEVRIRAPKKSAAPVAKGDLAASEIQSERGLVCIPEDFDFGSGGSASGGGTARGKITITARTETTIEGTVDVKDWRGKATKFAFTAPLCGPPAKDAQCCAGAASDDE